MRRTGAEERCGGPSCVAALESLMRTGSGRRFVPHLVVRFQAAALVASVVALVVVASASAVRGPTLPGELFGPGTVHSGTRYKWHGEHLAPAEVMHASVQPRYCYGEPGCIARVRGSWKTGAVEGQVHFAFVFPSRYRVQCELQGCDPTPAFQTGEEVVVRACVNGPTSGAHYGYRCLLKIVVIGEGSE
jgi:hypothetical protein